MVTVHNPDGSTKDITDKRQIEQAILQNNKAKFQQSFHTPFMTQPSKNMFGFQGDSVASRQT